MPILKNARWEAVCIYRVNGMSQIDAYHFAGYVRDNGQSTRLFQRPAVRARIAELQQSIVDLVIERRAVSKETLTYEMDENRLFAFEKGNSAAAQTATRDKAKMHGFMRERLEHTGNEGEPLTVTVNLVPAKK